MWNTDNNVSVDRVVAGSFAGDVYFDIKSIGERYGKFGGAADSQPEPGKPSKHKNKSRDGFHFVGPDLVQADRQSRFS